MTVFFLFMKKNILRFLAFSLAIHFFIFSGFSSYAMLDDLNNKKEPSVKEWLNDGFWNDDISFQENMYNYMKLALVLGGSTATAIKMTGGNPMVTPVVVSGLVSMELMAFIEKNTKDNKWGDVDFREIVSNGVKIENDTVEFSDEVVDCIHNIYVQFLEETSGYVVIPTIKFDDLPVNFFNTKDGRERIKEKLVAIDEPTFLMFMGIGSSNVNVSFSRGGYNFIPWRLKGLTTNKLGGGTYSFSDWYDCYLGNTEQFPFGLFLTSLNDDWSYITDLYNSLYCFNHDNFDCQESHAANYSESIYYFEGNTRYSYYKLFNNQNYAALRVPFDCRFTSSDYHGNLVSLDGISVKVWKSLDSFKEYNIGKQPYYTSNVWNNYDYSADNSQKWNIGTLDKSVTDSHNTENYNEVVNNISNGMTEKEVSHLVETILKNQNDNYNTPPSSDGSGGSSTGGSGGTGLGALLDGIGGLLDFITTLVGKVVSLITDTLTTILNSFSGFTNLFSGFSEFLASAFSFVPEEVWTILVSGCSVMVVLAIIKFLKG